ncbi:hypothetical protein D3C75_1322050 [compost metagenome]
MACNSTHSPSGEISGDLITTALPAARAGARERAQMDTGKFHGTICSDTPIGS